MRGGRPGSLEATRGPGPCLLAPPRSPESSSLGITGGPDCPVGPATWTASHFCAAVKDDTAQGTDSAHDQLPHTGRPCAGVLTRGQLSPRAPVQGTRPDAFVCGGAGGGGASTAPGDTRHLAGLPGSPQGGPRAQCWLWNPRQGGQAPSDVSLLCEMTRWQAVPRKKALIFRTLPGTRESLAKKDTLA